MKGEMKTDRQTGREIDSPALVSLLFSRHPAAFPFLIYFLSSHVKVNYLWIVKDYRRTIGGSLISLVCRCCNVTSANTGTYSQITWITNRFLFFSRVCLSFSLSLLLSTSPSALSFSHPSVSPQSSFSEKLIFHTGAFVSFCRAFQSLIRVRPMWICVCAFGIHRVWASDSMPQVEWAALIGWI